MSKLKGSFLPEGFFIRDWSVWTGGVLLALLALGVFVWHDMWGITAGFRNWGDWFFYGVGLYPERPEKVWLHPGSITNAGLLAGAVAAAFLSGRIRLRRSSWYGYVKSLTGGTLMGIGAALAAGCNVGGFYNATAMFSLGGYAMLPGLILGGYLGVRFLRWELYNIATRLRAQCPCKTEGKSDNAPEQVSSLGVLAGWCFVFFLAGLFLYYLFQGHAREAGLLLLGALIGITLQRSRLCFAQAFREPFINGDYAMVKVIAFSLVIYGLGAGLLKLALIQPESAGVQHPFWLGSFSGGVIFGFGMLQAGTCATGTLWRAGEGHVRVMLSMLAFAVFSSLGFFLVQKFEPAGFLGEAFFLPELMGWPLSFLFFLAVPLLWLALAAWNAKTGRMAVFGSPRDG